MSLINLPLFGIIVLQTLFIG